MKEFDINEYLMLLEQQEKDEQVESLFNPPVWNKPDPDDYE